MTNIELKDDLTDRHHDAWLIDQRPEHFFQKRKPNKQLLI